MIRAVIGTFLVLALVRPVLGEETWAEKLGYPTGKRVLVLHAQHMGAAYECNQSGQELLGGGLVQSVGLMPAGPWFDEFADWCREHPGHDVGICLSFNSPGKNYRWGPVCSRGDVSSLVDADGYFWPTLLQFSLRADVEEVEREVHAQIQRARAAGVRPTHLMTDLGALLTRPDLAKVYLEAAEKHWVPAVMVELTPAMIERLRNESFPLSQELLDLASNYKLPKLDDIGFLPPGDSYEAKRGNFYNLVRSLPAGLVQIVAHPAKESAALKRMTPRWADRVWETQLLADPEVKAFLEQEGIVLTNWSEIMRRFEGAAPRPAAEAAEPAGAETASDSSGPSNHRPSNHRPSNHRPSNHRPSNHRPSDHRPTDR